MQRFVSGLAREPLVHFLLLSGIVFAADAWPRRNDDPDHTIRVSRDFIQTLASTLPATRGMPSTRGQLESALQHHIEEELLVREAQKLSLTDGDPIVRRRMAQKMKFLLEDASLPSPTDGELQAYLEAHQHRYAAPPALRLSQIFFDPEHTKPGDIEAARAVLEQDPEKNLGHPLPMGKDLGFKTDAQIDRLFVSETAQELHQAPVGQWVGPFPSRFGLHFVRVEKVRGHHQPDLKRVRKQVVADWTTDRRKETFEKEIEQLKAQYTIKIEWPAPATVAFNTESQP